MYTQDPFLIKVIPKIGDFVKLSEVADGFSGIFQEFGLVINTCKYDVLSIPHFDHGGELYSSVEYNPVLEQWVDNVYLLLIDGELVERESLFYDFEILNETNQRLF
jgi:hypothetical protein